MTRHLPGAEKQIAGRHGDSTADLLRNLRAGLVAVRRADGAVQNHAGRLPNPSCDQQPFRLGLVPQDIRHRVVHHFDQRFA